MSDAVTTTTTNILAPASAVSTGDLGPLRSHWAEVWVRLLRRPSTVLCMGIVAAYLVAGLLSFTDYFRDKAKAVHTETYIAPKLAPPALWLGTDIQGRSVFWRVLYGTRIALTITVLASLISLGIGLVLGLASGYFGGWIDDIITWLFTTVSSVPWILLVLALVYALKGVTFFGYELPELTIVIIALGLTDWVGLCRLIRGEVLKHRDRDYIQAARAAGAGNARIILRHILPNVFHIVIITFSLSAVGYVQAEVVLTFLGLGISDQPSWGRMIDDSQVELLRGVWWQLVPASVAIGVLCLALNLLGDALRDALDPRLRGVE